MQTSFARLTHARAASEHGARDPRRAGRNCSARFREFKKTERAVALMAKQVKCRWNCGRQTKNISRVCNDCWKAAELSRSLSEEGHRAWLETKRLRPSKSLSRAQRDQRRLAAIESKDARRTRAAKLNEDLPVMTVLEFWKLGT